MRLRTAHAAAHAERRQQRTGLRDKANKLLEDAVAEAKRAQQQALKEKPRRVLGSKKSWGDHTAAELAEDKDLRDVGKTLTEPERLAASAAPACGPPTAARGPSQYPPDQLS